MSLDPDETTADGNQVGHEQYRSEPALRAAIAQRLRDNGLVIEENVACPAGLADIITVSGDTIFEVKHRLTRKQVYIAVGQLLLYRQSINPSARAILVGYSSPEISPLLPFLTALGVEVMFWEDTPEGNVLRGEAASIALPSGSQRQTLVWAVQELALAQGLSSVSGPGVNSSKRPE